MLICGLQKLSLLNYPEKLAATVFTGGCNMRCPFCHNATLVTRLSESETISTDDVLSFLKKRIGILDGVCITGGEPLLQNDLEDFIVELRRLNFKIKLDTNGSFPLRLSALLDKGLIDYVALDIKNSPEKYPLTVGLPDFDPAPVFESASILMNSPVPHEFRTTLVREYHTYDDMEKIGRLFKGAKNYYLQSFEDSGDLVGAIGISPVLSALTPPEAEHCREILLKYIENVKIRN